MRVKANASFDKIERVTLRVPVQLQMTAVGWLRLRGFRIREQGPARRGDNTFDVNICEFIAERIMCHSSSTIDLVDAAEVDDGHDDTGEDGYSVSQLSK